MADEPTNRKTIGGLNGPWALLLKVMLASYVPVMTGIMAWSIWITSETYANRSFRMTGPRVTSAELHELERRMNAQFSSLPPADWQARIIAIESWQHDILRAVVRIETKLESSE